MKWGTTVGFYTEWHDLTYFITLGFLGGAVLSLHWGARASLVVHRLSCSKACGILVSRPRIKPASPVLVGGFWTTGPPKKSHLSYFRRNILTPALRRKRARIECGDLVRKDLALIQERDHGAPATVVTGKMVVTCAGGGRAGVRLWLGRGLTGSPWLTICFSTYLGDVYVGVHFIIIY